MVADAGSQREFCATRAILRASLLISSALFVGCSDFPKDPRDTTENAKGGLMRVGIAENPPWTLTDKQPGGVEVALVEDFASTIGARVEWQSGSESVLLERLEHFELDIVIAGLRSETPWKSRVAMTIPYLTADTDGDGKKEKHVMAVPPGENGWLTLLDRFLHANQRQALVRFSNAGLAAGEPGETSTARTGSP